MATTGKQGGATGGRARAVQPLRQLRADLRRHEAAYPGDEARFLADAAERFDGTLKRIDRALGTAAWAAGVGRGAVDRAALLAAVEGALARLGEVGD